MELEVNPPTLEFINKIVVTGNELNIFIFINLWFYKYDKKFNYNQGNKNNKNFLINYSKAIFRILRRIINYLKNIFKIFWKMVGIKFKYFRFYRI